MFTVIAQIMVFSGRQLTLALLFGLLVANWNNIDRPIFGLLLVVLGSASVLTFFAWRRQPPLDRDTVANLLKRLSAEASHDSPAPTLLRWLPTGPTPKPILLIPAADYHLAEIVPLAEELNRRGAETRIAVGKSPWERTRNGVRWYPNLEVFELPDPDTVAREVSAVVTMKDTGSMTDWVTDVRASGVPVIGKVEGAQDFWDADTPDERRPYRNLDLVLCQGDFDAAALTDRNTAIVGSSRLERLWLAPPVEPPDAPLVLINLNFVYGVLTSDRKLWLESAIAGCKQAGIEYVISLHPAETSQLSGPRITRASASRLLPYSSVLISRFSTVPLEAMALGVPFIYHNPHNERVITYQEPMNAYSITRSATALEKALASAPGSRSLNRALTAPWLGKRVSLASGKSSEARATDEVIRVVSQGR